MKDIDKIITEHDQAVREGRERAILVSAELLADLLGEKLKPAKDDDDKDEAKKKGK